LDLEAPVQKPGLSIDPVHFARLRVARRMHRALGRTLGGDNDEARTNAEADA
jgi:hypothetical protein